MGTGSFGGGSGSLGGGGSGSSGGGGSGSLLRAIASLRDLTRRLNQDGNQSRLTREIIDLLRDRSRASFVKDLLADEFTVRLLQDLLTIKARLDAGDGWQRVARHFGVIAGPGTVIRLCDWCIDQAVTQLSFVDERYINCAGSAFRGILQNALGGDLALIAGGDSAAVDRSLDRAPFGNPARHFLGLLLGQVIRNDSVHDLRGSWASVQTACHSVADAAYARFEQAFVAKQKADPSQMLQVLSEHYFPLIVG
jgi:hypothetical protein